MVELVRDHDIPVVEQYLEHSPMHARLSELVGSEVRLEPIPPPSDKDAYRAPRETKAEIRAAFGLAEDEAAA